jgi:hypothetical protein
MLSVGRIYIVQMKKMNVELGGIRKEMLVIFLR